ncbi:MAG: hypothetical protein I8H75_02095 [Myxococcaceae bacterium]|nr:hypothetical protein [Myxococcaceae bacterium]MBH2006127.1 hypothetical protein [Myxococcaceae bacterium]
MRKNAAYFWMILSCCFFSSATPSAKNPSDDLTQLIIDLDPKAYGYRAASHGMQVSLFADPFLNGRLTLDYELRLLEFLTMTFPISFDSTSLAITRFNFNPRVAEQWSLLAGGGIKYRLSEWMAKASFYAEFWLQTGVYAQQAIGFGGFRYAWRIRPSFYAGWERIFETGLLLGLSAGVEYDWDIPVGKEIAYRENQFRFIPGVRVGYAW